MVVPQKNVVSGCIPTGFEWIIKYQDVKDVDFNNFQSEFDFGKNYNGFGFNAKKVKEKYASINISSQSFLNGIDKVNFIKDKIEKDIPCLLALRNPDNGKFHAVPVVYIDDTKIKVIWSTAKQNGKDVNQTHDFLISDIIKMHNDPHGGKDIAWLEK